MTISEFLIVLAVTIGAIAVASILALSLSELESRATKSAIQKYNEAPAYQIHRYLMEDGSNVFVVKRKRLIAWRSVAYSERVAEFPSLEAAREYVKRGSVVKWEVASVK